MFTTSLASLGCKTQCHFCRGIWLRIGIFPIGISIILFFPPYIYIHIYMLLWWSLTSWPPIVTAVHMDAHPGCVHTTTQLYNTAASGLPLPSAQSNSLLSYHKARALVYSWWHKHIFSTSCCFTVAFCSWICTNFQGYWKWARLSTDVWSWTNHPTRAS